MVLNAFKIYKFINLTIKLNSHEKLYTTKIFLNVTT